MSDFDLSYNTNSISGRKEAYSDLVSIMYALFMCDDEESVKLSQSCVPSNTLTGTSERIISFLKEHLNECQVLKEFKSVVNTHPLVKDLDCKEMICCLLKHKILEDSVECQ